MLFEHVRIEGIGYEEAPLRVTSAAIEDDLAPVYERLGVPKSCLEALTGIVARRFWQPDAKLHKEAALAGAKAIGNTDRDGIGLLVSTSVSKELLEPSIASMVQGELGLRSGCENFDVGNACLGFVSGMRIASHFIETGAVDRALVVAAESSRNVVGRTVERLKREDSTMQDYKDYLPTLTLGSGAIAMLLSHEQVSTSPHRFNGTVLEGATEYSHVCQGTMDWMRTDATTLLKEGVALADRVWTSAQDAFGWNAENVGQYICHQVGATHLATLFHRLGLPLERAHLTYPEFGNMGSAALPMTLALAERAGKLHTGEEISLMGIGSGLNCAMASITW